MRRTIRGTVLAEHLERIHGRRDDLRRVLGGGRALVAPTREEKERLQEEYVELAPLEAGLAALVPTGAKPLEDGERVPQRVEARILSEVRDEVAVLAVTLLQTPRGEDQDQQLERALAVSRYLNAELQRMADDDAAMVEASRLESLAKVKRPADGGFSRFVTIGGWAMLIGGWW